METTHPLRAASSITRMNTGRYAVAAFAMGMLAFTALFFALRLASPSDGAAGAYVTSSWTDDGVRVTLLPGSDTVLQTGDRVVAIEGRSLSTWFDDLLDPGVAHPGAVSGETLGYRLIRDGATLDLQVPLAGYPLLAVLLAHWSTLAWLLLMTAVGLYLFLRRPDEAASRALATAATAILASTLPWLAGLGPRDLSAGGAFPLLYLVATIPVYAVFWSALLHFGLSFPRPLSSGPAQARLVLLAYLLPLGAQTAWMAGTLPGSATVLGWVGGWTLPQLIVVPAVIVASLAIMGLQWRRAETMERNRIRWIAAASLLAAVGVLAGWFLPEAVGGGPLLPWSFIGLPGLAFPLAVMLAVNRHHLFGIETIVRRSLVYGGLTAGVVSAYVLSVVVIGAVLPGEGLYAEALLATGIAALVALPLRDRLQQGVSRLIYGDRDEPQRAMARLSQRLAASLEPEAVLPMVAETVAEALRLPYAAIELRRDGGAVVAAAHGTARGRLERLPLVHQGEEIGWLAFAPRTVDDEFGAADRALLAELARQAGAAAYAVRLTGELQRSRQQLVSAREEERRRLRRDLHDGIGPSLAGSLMKLEAARDLAGRDPDHADALLAELTVETRQAIDDVRRLAYDLRPPALDQLGVAGALDQEAQRLSANGLRISVEATSALPPLPAAVEVAAYRIGLEALTNVAHHAGAHKALLRLQPRGDCLEVEVRDDGRGMGDRGHHGVGLSSMRERAEELDGELIIGSAPEGGVLIRALLPLPTDDGHA